jgi:hypothetical protein
LQQYSWSKIINFIICSRYDEIEGKMVPFLKSSGYNVKKGIIVVSASSQIINFHTQFEAGLCAVAFCGVSCSVNCAFNIYVFICR